MTAYYVETSALLKRYRSEAGSDVANELFDGRIPTERFLTSHFGILEVNAVASRMLKGRVLRRVQYERLMARFLQDLDDHGMIVLPMDDGIVQAANALLPDCALRAPDALHFATALRAKPAVGGQPYYMVSADKEIGEACSTYGFSILDPEARRGASVPASTSLGHKDSLSASSCSLCLCGSVPGRYCRRGEA